MLDDTAVLPANRSDIVLTHDMLVEGVHFLPVDPPADVAWKLIAVNLSDLAAKGARPAGVLLGYSLKGDAAWDAAFVDGLGQASKAMGAPLLGGDTVGYRNGPRVLSLTAIGYAPEGGAPSRSGAAPGDRIWVSGTIGDAGLGLRIARQGIDGARALADRYRRPVPRVTLGRAIARHVTAMMDVSDGLLIDLRRLADASGVAALLDLDAVSLSAGYRQRAGTDRGARLAAATSGDDYELLFTAPAEADASLRTHAALVDIALTPVGRIAKGRGISIRDGDGDVPLPARLGYEHGGG